MYSLYTQILHPDGLCLRKRYIAFRNLDINYVRLKPKKEIYLCVDKNVDYV